MDDITGQLAGNSSISMGQALAQAKQAGRPKFIELAAFELGQAIGDRALLNLAMVNAITTRVALWS